MKAKLLIIALLCVAGLSAAPGAALAMDGIPGGGTGGTGGATPGPGDPFATLGGMVENAGRYVRDVILDRLGGDSERGDGLALWIDGRGNDATREPSGAAAGASEHGRGVTGGMDFAGPGGWRWGVAAGASEGDMDIGARQSSADLSGRHVAAYGGGPLGPLLVRLGAAWSETDATLHRTDTTGTYRSAVDLSGTEAFGEIAYQRDWRGLRLEPYLMAAWSSVRADPFTETGGTLPLTARNLSQDSSSADLGLRARWGSGPLHPYLGLAWRRRFGDLEPTVDLSSGTTGLGSATGASQARDAAIGEAGVVWKLGDHADLRVRWRGEFSGQGSDQSGGATLAWSF
jgi:outer membrane autotransporter protein